MQTLDFLSKWMFFVHRESPPLQIEKEFENLYKYIDSDTICKLIRCERDRTKGLGERDISVYLAKLWWEKNPFEAKKIITEFPKIGRWGDLLDIITFGIDEDACQFIYEIFAQQLKVDLYNMGKNLPISLASKWAPNENGGHDKKYKSAKQIAAILRGSLADYRKKYLSPLRKYGTIYESICNNNPIPHNILPTKTKIYNYNSLNTYENPFANNLSGLQYTPPFPYEIVNQIIINDENENSYLEEEWTKLINYYGNRFNLRNMPRMLIICDMENLHTSNWKSNLGLSMILSSLAPDGFKNQIMVGMETPFFAEINNLDSIYSQITILMDEIEMTYCSSEKQSYSKLKMIRKCIEILVSKYVKFDLDETEIPEMICILSNFENIDETLKQNLDAVFTQIGYTPPSWIFWNTGGIYNYKLPCKSTDKNVGLLKGHSLNLFQILLEKYGTNSFDIYTNTKHILDKFD